VLERLDHLDHAADTGGRLGVAEVRLERAEPQWTVRGAAGAVGREQRLRLDRVAQPGSGAVRLHDVHVGGGEARVGERVGDHPLLGRPVRRGHPAGAAVLVDRGPAQHGEHRVPVAFGVGPAFQQQHSGALGPAGAVRGGGERLAVDREPALPAELHEHAGGGHHGRAAGQRQLAVPAPQRLHGEVDGDQRGRARGVDRERGALQAEGVGDPAGRDAERGAGQQVPVDRAGRLVQPGAVVGGHGADEHAGAGPSRSPRAG
jgi:hypothetical protein